MCFFFFPLYFLQIKYPFNSSLSMTLNCININIVCNINIWSPALIRLPHLTIIMVVSIKAFAKKSFCVNGNLATFFSFNIFKDSFNNLSNVSKESNANWDRYTPL